jgi:pimeloyl-ACP methyl ester carboxylesterase
MVCTMRHGLPFVLSLLPACARLTGPGAAGATDLGCCVENPTAPAPAGDLAAAAGSCPAQLAPLHGYPGDFPMLVDSGGFGVGEPIQGFGGDTSTNQACNRAALQHRPVVLIHGNGVNSTDAHFGMAAVRDRLRGAGYVDAEIWAPSYLGQAVSSAEVPTPQRTNVADVRGFIDAVLTYLGVDRVDLVGHSLGCAMINDYLRGLQPDGSFDATQQRFDQVGTVVCLGGALYGMGDGPLFEPEYDQGGAWVHQSITLNGVEDTTPFGASSTAQMNGPTTGGTLPGARPFHATTSLDAGQRRIYWVALWAIGDVVDVSEKNGGGLGGADLNQVFDLPASFPGVATAELARHAELLHSQAVFDAFRPYLNQ